MRLGPGARLSGYEVVSALGEGGMGEVYRALDTTLHRYVAIKLVHQAFCHHPDSLLRLRREARALASLNHPHIATLYELAEFDGGCGLVMELVDGETLAEAMAARRLKLADVLRLGSQIAAALEAAHEHGLVHRDLKPANIKITSEGAAKVLDFGLVKSEHEPAGATALSTLATASGAVVGTACYMSPEQARGASVDRRTDVWAFGCVLYEMLSGRRPFDGPTHSDVLVSVLEREPDWSALPEDTPPPVRRLVRRCLQKDVRRRLRDAGDARLELEDAVAAPEGPAVRPPAPESRRSWVRTAASLAAAAAIGGALVAVFGRAPVGPAPLPVQFSVTFADGERLGAPDLAAAAMSPDGRLVTYVVERGSATQLLLRRLDELAPVPVPATANALSPFFSPDSQWIGFFADGKLKKVPVAGGPAVTICDAGGGFGATWGDDGTIVFAPEAGSALQRVSGTGGEPARATTLDVARGEFSHRWPEFLPGSSQVLFTVGTVGEWDEAEIAVQSLATGQRTTLVKGGTHPHYLAGGFLAYTHGGAVWAAPLDLRRLTLTGPAARVIDGVAASVDGAAPFAVSPAGTSVHLRASPGAAARRLIMVEGSEITPLAASAHRYVTPRLSPDGRRVLVGVADESEHIWSYDLRTSTLTQITLDAANRSPIWTADGLRATFASNRNGAMNLFVAPADGRGSAERLTTSDALQLAGSWSPDGTVLAFMEQNPASGRGIWLLRRGGERVAFADSPADESAPRFSPDGRWIAYVSTEPGQAEIFARPSSATGLARRISTSGGVEPVWRRDGGALYYRAQNRLMALPVLEPGSLRLGPPRVVFDGMVEPGTFDTAGYDALPGTDRFLMIASAAQNSPPTELQVTVNWAPALPAR
jgi:hypothetical protein